MPAGLIPRLLKKLLKGMNPIVQAYVENYDLPDLQGMLREKRKIYFAEKGMNGFACEELFPMESRRTLLLKFQEKQPGHYLNGSMVRFVVSQMQLEINEYRCVGVIL